MSAPTVDVSPQGLTGWHRVGGGTCGARWELIDRRGLVPYLRVAIRHCGHPTAIWPYSIEWADSSLDPARELYDAQPMLSGARREMFPHEWSGGTFRRLDDARAIVWAVLNIARMP